MMDGISSVADLYRGDPEVDRILLLIAGRKEMTPTDWGAMRDASFAWAHAKGLPASEGERMYEHVRARVALIRQQVRGEA